MLVRSDLPLTSIPVHLYSLEMTPELQLAMCLSWAKERMSNSKASSSNRLASIVDNIADLRARTGASVPNLSARNIESAARQLGLQATSPSRIQGAATSFAVLGRIGNSYVQTPVIIIVWTDKGFAYPTVAYKSGGKVKGLGSHLYVFLPICGELKMSPKDAAQKLGAGVHIDTVTVGSPSSYDVYVIATDSDPVVREVENELYDSGATGGTSVTPSDYEAPQHVYRVLEGPTPASRPISPRPFEGWQVTLDDPDDPNYAVVGRFGDRPR